MAGLIRIIGCLLFIFCSKCFCVDDSTNNESPPKRMGNETWIAMEKSFRSIVQRLLKEFLPTVMRMRDEVELSNRCSSSLMQLVLSLRQMKLWALKMLDATAKPTPGILMGTISAMGSYRECIVIESDGRNPFQGQYCTVEFLPSLPEKPEYVPMYDHDIIMKDNSPKIPLATRLQSLNSVFYVAKATVGLCIPSTCNEKDLEAMAVAATSSLNGHTSVSRCEIKREMQFSREQIIVIAILIVISVLVVMGTIVEMVCHRKSLSEEKKIVSGRVRELVMSFSINNSLHKLFSRTSIKICSPLHGIHVLSILWIIVGMTYKTYQIQYLQYGFHLEEENNKLLFETIPSARSAFNTLYFLSGLLTAYFAVKNKEENRFNFIMFILLRYLRLTPLILISLGFIVLTPLFGSGPIWKETVENGVQSCQDSWWTYIVYISNWRKHEDMCTFAFQYASSLFQLHILALILIAILYKYVRIGIVILLALGSASIVSIAVLTYEYRLFPTVTKLAEDGFQKLLFEKTSLQPYCHMGPYVVGLFIGYILVRHSTMSVKMIYQIIAWIFATSVCLAVVYYPYFSHRRNEPEATETTILSSIYRIGWSISLGWIIFACATGRAGVINRFLSCSLFVSLSRLSHLAFFLLEYVILIRFGQIEQTYIYSHYNMAYDVFGHIFLVMLISFAGYILVDAPISNILQQLIGNFSQQKADLKKETKTDLQKVQLKTIMIHSGE